MSERFHKRMLGEARHVRHIGVIAVSLIMTACVGLLDSTALAKPGSILPQTGTVPMVLRSTSSDGDVGANVQDRFGRTIRATREPWRGEDSPTRTFVLRRFRPDGSVDRSFASKGQARPRAFGRAGEDWFFSTPLIRKNGGVVIVGELPGDDVFNKSSGIEIRSFTSKGAVDRSFSTDGIYRSTERKSTSGSRFELRDTALDAQGNVWVCGRTISSDRVSSAVAFAVAADGDGELAASRIKFSTSPDRYTSCGGVAASSDGSVFAVSSDHRKIEIIKRTNPASNDSVFGIAGVSTVDVAPIPDGTPQEIRVSDVALDPQGRILVSARLAKEQTPERTRFWRIASNGLLDGAFGSSGTTSIPFIAGNFWPQKDGSFLAGGFSEVVRHGELGSVPVLARVRSDGSRDSAWPGGGILRVNRLSGGFEDQLVISGRHYFGPATGKQETQGSPRFQRVSLR